MLVELLDSLGLDLVNARSELSQRLLHVLALLFEIIPGCQLLFDLANFVFHNLKIVFNTADLDFQLVSFLVEVENITIIALFKWFNLIFERFNFVGQFVARRLEERRSICRVATGKSGHTRGKKPPSCLCYQYF